jgi:hypothetical protein
MEFDRSRYDVWQLPKPLLLHWVLNPGLVVNELLLGQRIPKVTLIERDTSRPLIERQSVPCPHCGTLHDARLWSGKRGFHNWFGYYCPRCGDTIPCLWNVFSLLLLALTAPLWIWFRKPLRARWLRGQPIRFEHAEDVPLPTAKTVKWWRMGLIWGAIMFIVFAVAESFQHELRARDLLIDALVCLVSGALFSVSMWFSPGRSKAGSSQEQP